MSCHGLHDRLLNAPPPVAKPANLLINQVPVLTLERQADNSASACPALPSSRHPSSPIRNESNRSPVQDWKPAQVTMLSSFQADRTASTSPSRLQELPSSATEPRAQYTTASEWRGLVGDPQQFRSAFGDSSTATGRSIGLTATRFDDVQDRFSVYSVASSSRQASMADGASQGGKGPGVRPLLFRDFARVHPTPREDSNTRLETANGELYSARLEGGSDGRAKISPPPARRRSLRRPQPVQGFAALPLEPLQLPTAPRSSDRQPLHSPPVSPFSRAGQPTASPRRTGSDEALDRSPKRSCSSSPENAACKRSKLRSTAREPVAIAHIPRPPNSFMLYRSAQNKLLSQVRSEEGDKLQQADLSRMIAQMWKDETADVKEQYAQRAAAEKAEHALKYPGYIYRPKTSGRRKVIKFKQGSISPKDGNSRSLTPTTAPTTAPATPAILTSPAPDLSSSLLLSPFSPLPSTASVSHYGSATSDDELAISKPGRADWALFGSAPAENIYPTLTHTPFDYGSETSFYDLLPWSAPPATSELPWQEPLFALPPAALPSQSYPPSSLPDTPWSAHYDSASQSSVVDYTPSVNAVAPLSVSPSLSGRPQYDNALHVSGLLGFDGYHATLDPAYIYR
ncbi:hypothetical protein JCM10908_006433 [Rhodotorula pacifica]|uniref:HMG-box domain-containing protein n=1 Tax=Rhodotorula pacifica TaxID=1495444 RepID=UPI00316EE085